MSTFILIGLGGVLGANTRYFISTWAANRYGVDFPYGTLLVNATGSLCMGFVLTLFAALFGGSPEPGYFLATGFLGAYTTFSTFTYETIALLRGVEMRLALINVLGSALTGIAGCVAGIACGELLVRWLG